MDRSPETRLRLQPPLPRSPPLLRPVGLLGLGLGVAGDGTASFSRYSGVKLFSQLPISRKTKNGLKQSNFFEMTDILMASLRHALAGRDILGAAKTGSGKTRFCYSDKREEFYRKHREGLKQVDKEDKLLDCQRCQEKRTKEKMKRKSGKTESEEGSDNEQDDLAEEEVCWNKKAKIQFGSDDGKDEDEKDYKSKGEEKDNKKERKNEPDVAGSMTLEAQEALTLKLLSSMHKKIS